MLGALVTFGNSNNDESSSSSRKAPDWRRCCQRQPPRGCSLRVSYVGQLWEAPPPSSDRSGSRCGRGLVAAPWSNLGGRLPAAPGPRPAPNPRVRGQGYVGPWLAGRDLGQKKSQARAFHRPSQDDDVRDDPRRLLGRPRGRPRCVGPRRRPDPRARRAPPCSRVRVRAPPRPARARGLREVRAGGARADACNIVPPPTSRGRDDVRGQLRGQVVRGARRGPGGAPGAPPAGVPPPGRCARRLPAPLRAELLHASRGC